MKVPDKIPDWLAELPGDANLKSCEIMRIFSLTSITAVSDFTLRNKIPKPFGKVKNANHPGFSKLWKVSTIRNFIRECNRGRRNNIK